MLARTSSTGCWLARLALLAEACSSVFTLGSWAHQAGHQRDFSLAEAYASNSKKFPLFVQQLDQTPSARHQHSSLFYPHQAPDGRARSQNLRADHAGPFYDREAGLGEDRAPQGRHEVLEYSNYEPAEQPEHSQQSPSDNYQDFAGLSALQKESALSARGENNNSNNNNNSNSNSNSNAETLQSRLAALDEQAALDERVLLTRELIATTCHRYRGYERDEQLNNTYLTHCSRYKLENLFSSAILDLIMHDDSRNCERVLDEFIQLDETINQFDALFITLLSRYNCHNGYSVKWNCDDCKKAYKDWLCATHLPFYMNGERIKPCISFCERVEQRCPYLHPITREQYGGQPVFICRDPNIPFVPEITPDIPYSEPSRCYDLCHLSDNLTELITDSLSKYDYDKCPDRGSIAGEVRAGSRGQNDSKLPPPAPPELYDYEATNSGDEGDATSEVVPANRTSHNGADQAAAGAPNERKKAAHVHNKKLDELREVLANYKNQAKTHRYHADHSSIEHSKSLNDLGHSR